MNNSFPYTTVEQQIQKLKSQFLTFDNEAQARIHLETYGYYNIINGYRDPYIVREYDKKVYSSNVTFEQIFSLFCLDHNIRDAILLSMIDLEEHLKAITADIIAESFGTEHRSYLSRNNYRDKRVNDPKFSRNNILNGMTNVAQNSIKQPIKYYRETHNIVPPWILFKGIYFGTFVNFIRFLKGPEREKLVYKLYSNKVTNSNLETYKNLLSDTLFLCLEYRNLAAHGGRTYNYIPTNDVRFENEMSIKKGLPLLLYVLNCFDYSQPFERLKNAINKALTNYCSTYKDDITRLEQATGFSITAKEHVWLNPNSRIYHKNKYCSGSRINTSIQYTEDIKQIYHPCKKCFGNKLTD